VAVPQHHQRGDERHDPQDKNEESSRRQRTGQQHHAGQRHYYVTPAMSARRLSSGADFIADHLVDRARTVHVATPHLIKVDRLR
jgi:hypothetical protein